MRTISLYTFNELSDVAKAKAIENYREYKSGDQFDFSEYKESLREFCDDLCVEVRDWSYGLGGCDVRYEINHSSDVEDLSGVRAYKWIINNVNAFNMRRRVYREYREVNNHGFKQKASFVKWVSGVFNASNDCPYTGVCYDESLLKPFRDFLKKPDDRTIAELIREAIDGYCSDMLEDLEFRESDEYLRDDLENGDTPEFLKTALFITNRGITMKLNITAPGLFFNRSGDRVTVDQIVLENSAGAVVSFPVKGRIWKMYRGAYRPREFKIWTAAGKFYAGEQSRSPWDIVGEVVADDVRPVYWQDLTDDQKAQAAAKYHNGEGTPEDYFTYTPDQFIVINGDVYDLDAKRQFMRWKG
ncbi:hypothetical protein HWA87_gp83 [Salmonella phage 35]|uniref:Uncharacterized protein n=1 Tax=Salmonella phage 35 TaxID=1654888 RepID=A0A0N7CAE7_9CAUD|nr:hypothetical protein HWA87_gp83 [Salmonella phage 35]AKJ74146.1 hypothetical protein SP35_83 [Salmonella phage 35]